MSKNIKRQLDYLKVLSVATPKQRQAIIDGASKDLIYAICECALNCLKGNVNLTSSQKQKLSRHKNTLRSLANKKYPLKKKRSVLKQKGGFLGVLLKPILGLASLLLK